MIADHTKFGAAEVAIASDQARRISPDLFGIFFEDLNYAADGGLYAELIQNRSFEYSSADNLDWNFLTGWELIEYKGRCSVASGTDSPLHRNNPHYLLVSMEGEGGLQNGGFGGIALEAGEDYDVSLFTRVLAGNFGPLKVRLEDRAGAVLSEATLPEPTTDWTRYTTTLHSTRCCRHARFVLLLAGAGSLALDVISLFPCRTFCDRPNGLRPDLAQVIADLKPRFMRFPGGCLAHGDGLENMYRWKDTIGPIETRREQPNIWNYHQSVGLGYYEYFQFCEDIGAKPLPVVPAGVCCQNTGAKYTGLWEQGQCGLPLEDMPGYVQEVLDLIEWANGPVTSTWGAKRAEGGHPQPFGLEYLGIGNEDQVTPVFRERFKMIYEAVRAKHPEITVIGTVGAYPDGPDYDEGWRLARSLKLEMVDEHVYRAPEWFWDNLERFEAYDRNAAGVYLGEYAAHDFGLRNTLRSALAEAAYMTALERNGNIVKLASYAPLLGKQGHLQWVPDLIYFDNSTVCPSINYYVQQLFSLNAGDTYLPAVVKFSNADRSLAVSCVRDTPSGDIILKLVNRAEVPVRSRIDLSAAGEIEHLGTCTVLCGEPLAENAFGKAPDVLPQRAEIVVDEVFSYEIPAYSLNVIRVKAARSC